MMEVEDGGQQEKMLGFRPNLTPEKMKQLMTALAKDSDPNGIYVELDSPPPTDDELQQFLDYMEAGVLNEDRLEYEERKRREQEQPSKRMNKTASMYFYRQHYLSIIHEEDDTDHHSRCTTPRNSVASSYYDSLTEGDDKNWSREANGNSPVASTISTETDTYTKEAKIKPVRTNGEVWGSENSLDSLASVNSILSDESSLRSYGSISRRSLEVCDRVDGSASALSHILRQLPPPPKGPPSATPPPREEGKTSILVVDEQRSQLDSGQRTDERETSVTPTPEEVVKIDNDEETLKVENCEKDLKKIDEKIKVNFETGICEDEMEKRQKSNRSLFERQISDIIESNRTQNKPPKIAKKPNNTVARLKNLFKSSKKNDRSQTIETTEIPNCNGSEKMSKLQPKSEPNSPSIKRRFFQRSSVKMSKSRSETSLANTLEVVTEKTSKKKLKRSKSLNDGQSDKKIETPKLKSTNPFENSDDVIDQVSLKEKHFSISSQNLTENSNSCDSKTSNERKDINCQNVEIKRICTNCQDKSNCKICLEKNRVVSIYENLDDFIEPQSSSDQPRKVSISELIAECEDYVRTEQFTRDLSSQILHMYLQERSNHVPGNPFETDSEFSTPPATPVEHLYDVPSKCGSSLDDPVSCGDPWLPKCDSDPVPKFPFLHIDSRDSIYENEEVAHDNVPHEESPVDSAYGSDKKQVSGLVQNHDGLPGASATPGNEQLLVNRAILKKSIDDLSLSSCSDLSTVSTIKRAESTNYDSVMSEYESAMSDIEETMSHLSRRSRSLTPTLSSGPMSYLSNSCWDFEDDRRKDFSYKSSNNKNWGFTSLDRNRKMTDKQLKEDRQIGSITAVFDELKDYLSESDLSLDYKIALRRRKVRNSSNKKSDFSRDTVRPGLAYKLDDTELTGPYTPMLSERSDSRQRMRDYAETVLSIGSLRQGSTRSGSDDSSRSPHSSYSAPSTPVGPRRSLDSRYRRSPSVASEISSLLEPIPEEESGQNSGSSIYERRIEQMRNAKAAARQEFFKDLIPKSQTDNCTTAVLRISGENMTQTLRKSSPGSVPDKAFSNILPIEDHSGLSSTLPRSGASLGSSDYGSLKRRKTLRSASLGSLLQNREETEQPVTEKLSPANPLIIQRSNTSSPITFTSSVRVQYKTKLPVKDVVSQDYIEIPQVSTTGIFWARQWDPNEDIEVPDVRPLYGTKQFSRPPSRTETEEGAVMVKECSCGQKITFDPISECWPVSKSQSATSVRQDRELFQPRTVDGYSNDNVYSHSRIDTRACDNVYFAYPIELVDEDFQMEAPPPRPPPPENYDLPQEWNYFSLPRKMAAASEETDFYQLRKSFSTSQMNESNKENIFVTPFDRFITSSGRRFDLQKVAG